MILWFAHNQSEVSKSAVYFSAVTNICPQAAGALLRPAQNWMHILSTRAQKVEELCVFLCFTFDKKPHIFVVSTFLS